MTGSNKNLILWLCHFLGALVSYFLLTLNIISSWKYLHSPPLFCSLLSPVRKEVDDIYEQQVFETEAKSMETEINEQH